LTSAEAFTALAQCSALRPVIHLLTAVLQNIVIDAPAAVIWNKFKVSTTDKLPFILSQLCGSPLDLLPCAVHELPLPPGKVFHFKILRDSCELQKLSAEVRLCKTSAKLVNSCLEVIGILDSSDIFEPNVIAAIATRIFNFRSENWENYIFRLKLMLHWAVTAEREGSYRAVIVTKVCHLLQSYIILNYFYTEAPTVGSKHYHQEFASLVILFIELSRHKLFDFVRELIKSGELDYQRPVMDKYKDENKITDVISSSLISAQVGVDQTYYDQLVICGWCAESFSDMIRDFVFGNSLQMPTSEGLDIICGMFESAQYIYGIFEFCEAVGFLEKIRLAKGDSFIAFHRETDVIPGTMSGQLGYVFVGYICRHWHYFLHSGLAPTITNHMYELIERMIRAHEYPMTSWGRTIAAFVYHSKCQLKKAQVVYVQFTLYIAFFYGLFLIFIYACPTAYKKRLPSFGQLYNRYSFVVNSFIAAKNFMRDHDRLSDLATFCGHISAQIAALADEWINDCSTHYPLATFVMLLAGKYAFSVPRLIAELLNNAFPVIMKREQSSFIGRYSVPGKTEYDYEPGVCLTLLILAQISCGTDEPFHCKFVVSVEHSLCQELSMFSYSSVGALRGDYSKNKVAIQIFIPSRIVDSTNYRREYLMILLKAVQSIICEEDWVTMKMFRIVETNRMEAFNHDRLKQNCLGQQLLRLGIRRRCERDVVRELSVCNVNSKKALIDKLLSVMNMWNMRATLFDLMLMIKEISPEGAQKHAQQSAIAADALMGEIGKCCRDLFTNAHKEGVQLPSATLGRDFRFCHVTNFWLIALLVRLCPQPSNVPNQFHHMTVGELLNTEYSKGITSWLLSQQPFLNLVLACLKGEVFQPNKDMLVSSLYKQLLDLTSKTKEREGLLLRLSLVGGIFKQVILTNTALIVNSVAIQ
uniref:Med12-LCEWAV domain-containing protein n=1 Tax=Angiostrongylus cantonensis TaxID=6313 RepID=A0A0K0D178_ANGCA